MHDLIERGLEDYLGGSASHEFEAHLASCGTCREEVLEIQELSGLLSGMMTVADPVEPRLGFSSRVLRNIQAQRKPSFWNVLVVDPGFARNIVVASLLGIAVLGGYLASAPGDSAAQADHTPEAVLASHDVTSTNQQQHRNGMLFTLATYHQK